MIKNLSAMWKTWVLSLGWEDPLEEDDPERDEPRLQNLRRPSNTGPASESEYLLKMAI